MRRVRYAVANAPYALAFDPHVDNAGVEIIVEAFQFDRRTDFDFIVAENGAVTSNFGISSQSNQHIGAKNILSRIGKRFDRTIRLRNDDRSGQFFDGFDVNIAVALIADDNIGFLFGLKLLD